MTTLQAVASSVVGHTGAVGAVATLLAHQGGWDEMLMVIVPVGAFAALLYGANRRASRLAEQPTGTGADSGSDAPSAAPTEHEPRNDRGGPI